MEDRSFLDESLKIMSSCPVCQGKYNKDSVVIVDKNEDSYLLHITCPHCASNVLAYVMPTGVGLTTIGLLTDMQSYEVDKFSKLGPITNNDILDFYKMLNQDSKVFIHNILNN